MFEIHLDTRVRPCVKYGMARYSEIWIMSRILLVILIYHHYKPIDFMSTDISKTSLYNFQQNPVDR
jgi:hypothetical protein